jgi:hypothetical protein
MSLMKIVSFIAGLNLKENEIEFEDVDRMKRGKTEQIYDPKFRAYFGLDFPIITKIYNIAELKN